MVHPIVRMFHDEIRQVIDQFSDQRFGAHPAQRRSLVVILRGLPGSGKSTFAALLKVYAEGVGLEAQICSADDFFDRHNGSRFELELLGEAHARCQEYCRLALQRGVPVVIIDNTNVKSSEWMTYVNLAVRGDHAVCRVNIVVEVALDVLIARSVHEIPKYHMVRREMLFRQDNQLYAPHVQATMRDNVFVARDEEVDQRQDRMHPMQLMFFEVIHDQLVTFANFRRGAVGYEATRSLVFVLRGLPGCGKSTFALLAKIYAQAMGFSARICSSDDHFRSRAGFHYDPNEMAAARALCYQNLRFALHRHVDVVIVDDPNIDGGELRTTLFEASLHLRVIVNFRCATMELAAAQLERTFTHCARVDMERLQASFDAFHAVQLPADPPPIEIDPIFNTWDTYIAAEANRATQPRGY